MGVDVLPNNLSANVSFYTSNGERLRSPSEVAHYLKNKLVLLPSCKNIPPPAPIAEIPLASDLSPENKAKFILILDLKENSKWNHEVGHIVFEID